MSRQKSKPRRIEQASPPPVPQQRIAVPTAEEIAASQERIRAIAAGVSAARTGLTKAFADWGAIIRRRVNH